MSNLVTDSVRDFVRSSRVYYRARWVLVPVRLGYPRYYNARSIGPGGCCDGATVDDVKKLEMAVGVGMVEGGEK